MFPIPANNIARDYSQIVARLRADYAAGMRPVPQSLYAMHYPMDTLNHYGRLIDDIKQYSDNMATSLVRAETALKNATTSLNNAATTLSDATIPKVEGATLLEVAAILLNDAAKMLNPGGVANLIQNAANDLRVAAISLTDGANDTSLCMTGVADLLTLAATQSANNYDIVFVYDIEEISALSRNYIAEYLTKFPGIPSQYLHNLVESVMKLCNFGSYMEAFNEDLININDAVDNGTELMRRMVPKYNTLRQLYNEISNGIRDDGMIICRELIDKCGMSQCEPILCQTAAQLQQILHQRWRKVKQCLELVNKRTAESTRKFANVVISGQGVGFGASQLLASGCAPFIPIENVFSTAKTSKEAVFNRIQERFGEKCLLVYVTSPQTSYIPEMPQLRVWPVEAVDSIESLYNAQRDHLLR